MNKSYRRVDLCLLFAMALFLLSVLFPPRAEAQPLAYGTGITVDGDCSDWDLNEDFYANMYLGGRTNRPVLSSLYLRYDCADSLLYILVLDNSADNLAPESTASDAWLKIYNNGWANNKLIDGNSDGNTSPRSFSWVVEEGTLLGYEAAAHLLPSYYAEIEAHLNVDGETSSTGKYSQGNAIELEIACQPGDTASAKEQVDRTTLAQNYPNPFNPDTHIDFHLEETSEVQLQVFDMQGRLVATLANGLYASGHHSVHFNAASLPSGMYVYSLTSGHQVQTRKLVLLK